MESIEKKPVVYTFSSCKQAQKSSGLNARLRRIFSTEKRKELYLSV